jgi:CheY-like chemotaxis protein
MPEGDGQEVLESLRLWEARRGIHGLQRLKVVMTTSVEDRSRVMDAFRSQAQAYVIKPVDHAKLRKVLKEFGVLSEEV